MSEQVVFDASCIRRLREGLGMTQDKFAEKLQVSKQRISEMELKGQKPNVRTLERIMTVFKVEADFFFRSE